MTPGKQIQMRLTFEEKTLWDQIAAEARSVSVQLLAQLLKEVLQAERREKEVCHEREDHSLSS